MHTINFGVQYHYNKLDFREGQFKKKIEFKTKAWLESILLDQKAIITSF